MKRTPEPELMLDTEQARAYAVADFSDSDDAFVKRFQELFGPDFGGEIVDLGCGPGNITFRMAAAYPQANLIAVDGSGAMLEIARERLAVAPETSSRIRFLCTTLPSREILAGESGAVVSNSLLHHLHDPGVLWRTVRKLAAPGAAIYISDLRRPADPAAARNIVECYAGSAPAVLQEDFFNSLLAAFEPEEVTLQLSDAGMVDLQVAAVGDRYLEISGRMPARS